MRKDCENTGNDEMADLVQVAPGKYVARDGTPPEQVIAETFFNADGTLGIRPLKGARNMRLTRHSIRALGFDKRLTTLVRLARAGFIEVSHPSPGIRLLNVDSWFDHLRRTQEDPDFWDEDGENWRNYMMRNGLRVK